MTMAFDGVQFNAGNHKLNFQAAYGYGIEGGFATDIYGQNTIDKNGNFNHGLYRFKKVNLMTM